MNLKTVDIESNHLRRIDVDFRKLQNLKRIDLSQNECIDVEESSAEKLETKQLESIQDEINRNCVENVDE